MFWPIRPQCQIENYIKQPVKIICRNTHEAAEELISPALNKPISAPHSVSNTSLLTEVFSSLHSVTHSFIKHFYVIWSVCLLIVHNQASGGCLSWFWAFSWKFFHPAENHKTSKKIKTSRSISNTVLPRFPFLIFLFILLWIKPIQNRICCLIKYSTPHSALVESCR